MSAFSSPHTHSLSHTHDTSKIKMQSFHSQQKLHFHLPPPYSPFFDSYVSTYSLINQSLFPSSFYWRAQLQQRRTAGCYNRRTGSDDTKAGSIKFGLIGLISGQFFSQPYSLISISHPKYYCANVVLLSGYIKSHTPPSFVSIFGQAS